MRVFSELAPQPFQLLQDDARVVNERVPGWRQLDPTRPAFEQRDAERLLHPANPSTGGRERHVSPVSAVRNASAFGHLHEQAQIGQIEAHCQLPQSAASKASVQPKAGLASSTL
jgi:hypothetical protein